MFIKNNMSQPVQMAEGVVRKVLGYGENIMTVEVKLEKGAVVKSHSHIHEQVSYIISGKFQFTIDGETAELSAGDSAYMASNILHSVIAIEEGMVVDSFSPIREDFIKQ